MSINVFLFSFVLVEVCYTPCHPVMSVRCSAERIRWSCSQWLRRLLVHDLVSSWRRGRKVVAGATCTWQRRGAGAGQVAARGKWQRRRTRKAAAAENCAEIRADWVKTASRESSRNTATVVTQKLHHSAKHWWHRFESNDDKTTNAVKGGDLAQSSRLITDNVYNSVLHLASQETTLEGRRLQPARKYHWTYWWRAGSS